MSARQQILDWADQGHLPATHLEPALARAGVLPDSAQWRRAVDRLLLGLGVLLMAAGLVFFLAYNWKDMGRFAKFGLAEAPLAAALLVVWRAGLASRVGQAALVGGAVCVGALLALVGQTYQTGADTFELFGLWATLILPWAVVGRQAPLWLIWLLLANVALCLYVQSTRDLWWEDAHETYLWAPFILNTAALAVGEVLCGRAAHRWALRLVLAASGVSATVLALRTIFAFSPVGAWGALAWALWMAAGWMTYRRWRKDVFALACGMLSLIVVATALLAKGLDFSHNEAFTFLACGALVVGLSAGGGWWLKRVLAEDAR